MYINFGLIEASRYGDYVNNTTHPVTFFYYLSALLSILLEISRYENETHIDGTLPSEYYRQIVSGIETTVNRFLDRYISFVRFQVMEFSTEKAKNDYYTRCIDELCQAFQNCNTYYKTDGFLLRYEGALYDENNITRVDYYYKNISKGYQLIQNVDIPEKNAFCGYPEGFRDHTPIFHNGKILMVNSSPTMREIKEYREQEEKWLEEYYDLKTAEGINAIPEIKNPPKWPGSGMMDVTGDIDYYLRFKSAEYEEKGDMELAILCLKKSNAIRYIKRRGYRRGDYYRLVRLLAQTGRIEEAYLEKSKIDSFFGEYYSDSDPVVITSLIERGMFDKADEMKRNLILKARQEDKYLDSIIPFEIQRGKNIQEYNWIKNNLPNICPKSYSAYRRMKNQNTKNYQKIVLKAKELNYSIE